MRNFGLWFGGFNHSLPGQGGIGGFSLIHLVVQSPTVQIDGEHETSTGWLYTLTIQWDDTVSTDHELTFAWVDHEHLVGGTISPSLIAQSAAKLAAGHFGQGQMPQRCDLSTLRRRIERFDEQIRSALGQGEEG